MKTKVFFIFGVFFVLILMNFLTAGSGLIVRDVYGTEFSLDYDKELVNKYICIPYPLNCLSNNPFVIGMIPASAIVQMSYEDVKLSYALLTHNFIEGYLSRGAILERNFETDLEGFIDEGVVVSGMNSEDFGRFVNRSFKHDFIKGQDVRFGVVKNNNGERTRQITFLGDELSQVSINGNVFKNIRREGSLDRISLKESQNGNNPAYILLNGNGEIIKADFVVNEKGGYYVLGNNFIEAPSNSHITFDGLIVDIDVYSDSSIKIPSSFNSKFSSSEIEIKGENIKLIGTETPAILNKGEFIL